jgi:hypothetical protein
VRRVLRSRHRTGQRRARQTTCDWVHLPGPSPAHALAPQRPWQALTVLPPPPRSARSAVLPPQCHEQDREAAPQPLARSWNTVPSGLRGKTAGHRSNSDSDKPDANGLGLPDSARSRTALHLTAGPRGRPLESEPHIKRPSFVPVTTYFANPRLLCRSSRPHHENQRG